MDRRPQSPRQPHREDRLVFHTVLSLTTPAGSIGIERNRIREVRLEEPFRDASPGFFFDRIVPIDLRRKLSEFKPHLWRSYISAYGQGQRFQEVIRWLQSRQEKLRRCLQEVGWRSAEPLDFQLTHRMVVGLGAASVWETGMVWHRPTGLPYIPASAIKGLTRAQIEGEIIRQAIKAWSNFQTIDIKSRQACLEAIDKWSLEPEADTPQKIHPWPSDISLPPNVLDILQRGRKRIFRLFGHTQQAGLVEFLDAFPTKPPKFELDVMNVHYPEYYQGKERQALDIESPNPVVFLTVADTPFRFIVLCDTVRVSDQGVQADELLKEATGALRQGLQTMGLGAKTRLGYGLFR